MSASSSSAEPLRVHLASLGCAKNLIDSEQLLARLAQAGALVGASADEADVILVNTCGFIAPARTESVQVIGEYAEVKARRPDVRLFVFGCFVVHDEAELRRLLPRVDRFFGLDAHEEIVDACGLTPPFESEARLLLTPGHTAYLRLSEGCDNACTYCTIPSIRGPFRSRPLEAILDEAADLVAYGARELNLIGQDTTSYGKDRSDQVALDGLLEALGRMDDLRWIRLLYAHPAHLNDRIIDAFRTVPSLCAYLDLPLQHLDTDVLRRMGRGMTYDETILRIQRLREAIPGLALRTTFIVGFPGETEAAFERLLKGIDTLRFDHVGIFGYSREPGTPAASYPDQLPEEEIAARVDVAMRRQQRVAFEIQRNRVGEEAEVLIDAPGATPDVALGRTEGQAPDVDSITLVHGSRLQPGCFVTARILDVEGYDLVAKVLDPSL